MFSGLLLDWFIWLSCYYWRFDRPEVSLNITIGGSPSTKSYCWNDEKISFLWKYIVNNDSRGLSS